LPLRTLALLFTLFSLLFTPAAAKELRDRVNWIYDGDTLQVENIGKVRLLGIDCPESKPSERDRYYLNNYSISPETLRRVAHEAKHFNIELVKGKQVRLRFDRTVKDRYGRLLAYLYLPDGRMLNRVLIEKGLASVYRRFKFREQKNFLAAEETARTHQLGLWQQ